MSIALDDEINFGGDPYDREYIQKGIDYWIDDYADYFTWKGHKVMCMRIITVLFVLFLVSSCGGDQVLIEPEQIIINEVMVNSNQISIAFDYTNSSITANTAECHIVNRELQISIKGGYIFPWNNILHSMVFDFSSDAYDKVFIIGTYSKLLVWPVD